MSELGIYLLRASISMSLLYMVYWLFLRRETLFSLNRFYLLAGFMFQAASQLDIKLRWGMDWDMDWDRSDQTFFDAPHFELVGD